MVGAWAIGEKFNDLDVATCGTGEAGPVGCFVVMYFLKSMVPSFFLYGDAFSFVNISAKFSMLHNCLVMELFFFQNFSYNQKMMMILADDRQLLVQIPRG